MSFSQSPLPVSIAGTLSDQMNRLEIMISKIGMNSPEQSMQLLRGFDGVSVAINELAENAPSRKPSAAQFAALLSRLRGDAAPFLRDLGGVQALRSARSTVQPPRESEWWYLDEFLADRRRASAHRLLRSGVIAAAALILLVVLYQRFLAPDPQVVQRYGHEQAASSLMEAGKYQQALDETVQGLRVAPGDPTLLTLQAVLLEALGQSAEAQQSFAAAEAAFPNREEFLLARAQAYIGLQQPEKAMADAQKAVGINPQSASGYLLMGQVYETQDELQEAVQMYEQAFNAAQATDQAELEAIARVRLGYVMQQISADLDSPLPIPSQTVTASP